MPPCARRRLTAALLFFSGLTAATAPQADVPDAHIIVSAPAAVASAAAAPTAEEMDAELDALLDSDTESETGY